MSSKKYIIHYDIDNFVEFQFSQALESKEYGNALHAQGNHVGAIKVYDSALEMLVYTVQMFPYMQPRIQRDFAIILTNRSKCFSALGNHSHALDDAKTAINVDPSWNKVIYNNPF